LRHFVVSDAGSASGTWVNGKQIRTPQELRTGDVIVVGQTKLAFQWSDMDQKPTEGWQPSKLDQS
jgi:pSer/pThr/pTyr-binding forkhead associated (FHA) protein